MAGRYFCCTRIRSCGGLGVESGSRRWLDNPDVQLDTSYTGYGVVIVKNGQRICGSGAALANTPILQSKAYFEAKLQSSGVWGVGLATRACGLQKVPLGNDVNSWVLRHDGGLFHNGLEVARLPEPPQEGDIIGQTLFLLVFDFQRPMMYLIDFYKGLTYNHLELNIFINGRQSGARITGLRGTIFPAAYVDDGAVLDMQFSHFHCERPEGFEQLMLEKAIL